MPQSLAHIALIVRDYDEAITWLTGVLGFTLVADEVQPEQDKRWVLVAPPGTGENAAPSSSPAPRRRSRPPSSATRRAGVFLFLRTDDFARDYEDMRAKGVTFVREPATHGYGTVAVFADLYGNLWDLVWFADRGVPRPA